MADEHHRVRSGDVVRFKHGLQILYARVPTRDGVANVAERDLDGEIRERYWIQAAQDVGMGQKTWATFEFSSPHSIERHELGRNRNDPGDGYRYIVRGDPAGTQQRFEWFEVTEVFEGVQAKNVKDFMRFKNGLNASSDFDPDGFLSRIDMRTPCRAAQRRAADKVITSVVKKLNMGAYEDM